ncbi:MAG: FlgD immunoglobulin-like domain containing protein [Calditrichia bacterium]
MRLIIAVILSMLFLMLYLFTGQETTPSEDKISGAYQALNMLGAQRTYPFQQLPENAHYAAFEQAKALRASKNKTLHNDSEWNDIGPKNLGGRTLTVALNPQNPSTVYAGSASGGLWRSYSEGRGVDAWEYVSTGFPTLAVSSITFAPGDSSTMYLGTGEVYNYSAAGTGAAYRSTRGSYGIGILKSTDGGATWAKSLDWSYNQQHGVWAIKVNPLNPNTVWAATTEGVYKSTDAGTNWNHVLDVIMATDLQISPVDTNIVFAGCGNFASIGHGVYRSTDSGTNWDKLSEGLPATFNGKILLDMTNLPLGNTLYASIGNGFSFSDGFSWLCSSVDNGENWTIETTLDYSKWQGWYSHDVAVNPTNPQEVFTVGIEIYKSTNGGSNLAIKSTNGTFSGRVPPEGPEGPATYSHPDHHEVVYHPTDSNILYFANDGGVFRTIDGGETFESCNGGLQTSQFYGGFSSAVTDSQRAIGGFQDNSTAIYDGQDAWLVRLIGGDGGWAAIDQTNAQVMYGSSQFLNVSKSTNGGQFFFNVGVPGNNNPTVFIAPFVLAPQNPQIIYAARNIVYQSEDGGSSWNSLNNGLPIDGNPVLAMDVSASNSDVVYVATVPFNRARGVHRTLDGGNTWTEITGNLPDRFPGDIAIDPTDPATVYITFSGFGTDHVYKSNDSGSSWTAIGQVLPDVPTSAVIVDPLYPEHVYVGNDIGVFASTDGGITWSDYSDALPDAVMVFDLAISPLNRKLRIGTHGNGAYERPLIDGSVGVEPSPSNVTEAFTLYQNYPNPFNPETTIAFELSQREAVTLRIFNSLGQEVRTLIENNVRNAGRHEVSWNGRNNSGERVASGVYLYQLKAGSAATSRRMILSQ